MSLTPGVWQAMRRQVSRLAPLEACGLLAGINRRVEMSIGVRNADQSPVRFHMEPLEQWRAFQRIESAGMELLGIYHSHPDGPDRPSPTDIAEAMYPVVQIIWYRQEGKWRARGFRIEAVKVREVALELVGNE
ncbi:MAG TPA: M67 family metallopeptidase [Anaerolineales bacterium]